MLAPPSEVRARRRRRAEDAQREILDAAEQLLRERPFRDVSPDDVMERTGLSRPSFYVYFRDRHDLVLKVVQRLDFELAAGAERWLSGGDDPVPDALAAVRGVVEVFVEHGPVIRAIADAAADDDRVEQAYRKMVQGFIDAVGVQLRRERRRGRLLTLDIDQASRALVWLFERYLTDAFGHGGDVDRQAVVQTLLQIVVRSVYRPEVSVSV